MKKLTYLLSFLLLIIFNIHCISNRSENEIIEPPAKVKSFPELSERNRLLGALLPERTCYDVLHYMINVDIDIDNDGNYCYEIAIVEDGNEIDMSQPQCIDITLENQYPAGDINGDYKTDWDIGLRCMGHSDGSCVGRQWS